MRVRRSGYSFILKVNWGYISAQTLESESSKSFAVSISPRTKPHQESLKSPRHQNIPQVPGNRAEVCENHDAREEVSATLLVLKWRGCIFWPRSSKVSFQKVMLCPFHNKAGPSGSSLQSPELENILQVPRNRDEVGQKYSCVYFTGNQGHQELVWSPRDWKISLYFREIEPKYPKITIRVRRSRLLFES